MNATNDNRRSHLIRVNQQSGPNSSRTINATLADVTTQLACGNNGSLPGTELKYSPNNHEGVIFTMAAHQGL